MASTHLPSVELLVPLVNDGLAAGPCRIPHGVLADSRDLTLPGQDCRAAGSAGRPAYAGAPPGASQQSPSLQHPPLWHAGAPGSSAAACVGAGGSSGPGRAPRELHRGQGAARLFAHPGKQGWITLFAVSLVQGVPQQLLHHAAGCHASLTARLRARDSWAVPVPVSSLAGHCGNRQGEDKPEQGSSCVAAPSRQILPQETLWGLTVQVLLVQGDRAHWGLSWAGRSWE